MDENAKEVLGFGRYDFWYYPGLALGIASFWVPWMAAVLIMLAASTGFVIVFLVKSTPRYWGSPELKPATRAFGLVGNLVLILGQAGMVAYRLFRLFS